MSETAQRMALVLAGWRLLVRIIGVGHIAVGSLWLADGPAWLVGNPVFANVADVPWWLWGGTAIASGLLILLPATAVPGLAATAVWYAAWSALLVPNLIAGGPFYAIGVYVTLTAVHVLVALVEAQHRRIARG